MARPTLLPLKKEHWIGLCTPTIDEMGVKIWIMAVEACFAPTRGCHEGAGVQTTYVKTTIFGAIIKQRSDGFIVIGWPIRGARNARSIF